MKTIKLKEYEWTLKLYHKDEINKYKKDSNSEVEDNWYWFTKTFWDKHITYVIVTQDYLNTVPHEITHFVTDIFFYLWINFDSELWAYNIWYYTKEYFKYLEQIEKLLKIKQ